MSIDIDFSAGRPENGPNRRNALGMGGSLLVGSTLGGSAAGAAMQDALRVRGTGLRIDRDTIVSGTLAVEPGARIVIAAGATLTVRGDVLAPAEPIFTGAGRVDLNTSRLTAARPEWWGAAPGDPGIDSLPALDACLAAHANVQLSPGDYFIGGTWRIARHNAQIRGSGRTGNAGGTRLVRAGGRGAVVLVGSWRSPGAINDHVRGVDMRGIELGRTEPGAANDGGEEAEAVGLAIRHVLDCRFEDLRANEHAVGYSIRGAVRTFLHDCAAFRSLVRGPRDGFVGFDMDGRAGPVATGVNASLYLIDCTARTGGRPRLSASIGVRMTRFLSDTHLVRLETTELANGIVIAGDAPTLSSEQAKAAHVNITIDTPVLDQCSEAGISISGLSRWAMLELRSPYVALSPAGRAAITVRDCGGGVQIGGGQMIGWLTPDATGLAIERSDGVAITGTQMTGFARPVTAIAATAFDLSPRINNPDGSPHPAVLLRGSRQGRVAPRVSGGYAAGVAMDAGSIGVTIERAGLGTLPVLSPD